jgi:hypothetical protein
MAAIINALFGTYPEPEQQNITTTNQTLVENHTALATERLHTSAVSDDVQVKSVISSETQANAATNNKIDINNLLSQLNTTHAQVDQYSRARAAAINEQAQKSIANVLANTQRQQEELLVDATRRHSIIENEYKLQLQKAVEALDAVKAKTLADLERDLQVQQQAILAEAKRELDLINDQANAAKLNVLVQAQEQAKENIDNLANQVVAIGQQETENLLQSTTTTIITSQAQAAETNVTVPVTEITNEQQVTSTTDNQSQVAVSSPTESVPAPTIPTAINTTTQETTTTVDSVNVASDPTTTSVEPLAAASDPTTTPVEPLPASDPTTTPVELLAASAPVDVTSNVNTVETEVKSS